ncbi:DEAD/DEAH box helicase family protein [Candidatus Shapirobacteria bacterium]|nr:DEAD/DEAH box helicase family protein [Candidatus Shapirobacteria bacterium]
MLYETFNANKESLGEDFFTSRIDDEVVRNLNPKFELREYQKEALGRFDFYFKNYQKRVYPAHLLFHMATGSGKTLIMAANILQLYKQGYRNFIFFVNSTNIIEKTKDNFLNPLSEKYLFASKIKFGGKEVFVKEVDNFEAASPDDINILFTTIQGLHIRLNFPKENALTYEDFADKEIVLISDEAHHLQTITKQDKKELELEKSWEYTVKKILNSNIRNILLEFTATIDLGNQNIRQKYEDKIIFQYDLKQFRLDKYSKEIEVLQADLEAVDRALQAVILSQYRRKIAEKYKLHLKPVLLFKSKSIKESKENYDDFLEKIKSLSSKDIQEISSRAKGTDLEKAFNYFKKENITFENLIKELQEDFPEEKVMLLDSENVDEEKQLKLNSLENKNNEIRAIFAVNMLNEGWDVLNLFDIVRLYDTRDGRWDRRLNKYKPGPTTLGEAQLIGRGARYFPFQLDSVQDKYKRKFDEDIENELRILETLHYHSAHNPRYIDEIKSTLTEMGIMPEKYIQKDLFIKENIKKRWKNDYIFINDRGLNQRKDIKSLNDAKIKEQYSYEIKTGEIKEEFILGEAGEIKKSKNIVKKRVKYKISDFGKNLIRGALDKLEFYKFEAFKKYFPHLKSIQEFIISDNYLKNVEIEIIGPENKIKRLTQDDKLAIVLSVVNEIADQAKINTSEYKGTTLFKAKALWEVFKDKKIKIDKDEAEQKEFTDIDLEKTDWYGQKIFYGTSEEKSFIDFISGLIEELKKKYSDIALLRNEKFFQIYDFDEGRAFEPDFVMLLKEKNHKITIYQVFIEPKGEFLVKNDEWKQKFLLDIEEKSKLQKDLVMDMENKDFKLIGLPFYNEQLKKDFEEALESKILR